MTIISYRHNFIFIKTSKTAGTSLEVHFSKLCGEEDVVTPFLLAEPATKEHQPRNYLDADGEQKFRNHMPMSELINVLDSEFAAAAYKFCFDRHPIDKSISYFSMLNQSPMHYKEQNPKTWDEYVARGQFPFGRGYYCDSIGTVLVDHVYRYEEMDAALRDISDKTSLPYQPLKTFAKSRWRRPITPSPEQRSIIMQAFERDNLITGYSD